MSQDPEEVIDALIQTHEEAIDPFEDDTPLECGIENIEHCESCQ